MKKFFIGIVMGAVLATAGTVYAADIKTLIGATIEGEIPVKVNGETLEKKAIFVDGTSYLPVRAIGDALNMSVSYDADLGVELTPKETSAVEPMTVETPTALTMTLDDAEAIKSSEEQIVLAEQRIKDLESKIAEVDNDISEEQIKLDTATNANDKIYYEARIKTMNADKDSLNASIKMDKEGILSQQAYIAKTKAKY